MAKCYVCERKSGFEHAGREICKNCFLKNMERRVKKHLGRNLFKKGNKVLVVGEVEKRLLVQAIGEMPLKLKFVKKIPEQAAGFDFIVYGKTMDKINSEFLDSLEKGKLVLGMGKKKFFNILEVLTAEEVEKYAELKKLKWKSRMKSKQGEMKYNLYKNIKELRLLN